jgi:hypothetical protein
VKSLVLILLIASPARGEGWRGGLRAEITGTVRVQRLVRGTKPDEQNSRSQIRFSLRTEAAPKGLRVTIADARVVSYEGPPALRNDLDREAAWYSAGLSFLVGRDGHFLDVQDIADTLRRVHANVERAPSFSADLHELALAGVNEPALRTMLSAEWEALAGDRVAGAKETKTMPLADGTLVNLDERTRRDTVRCADGASGCVRIVSRAVADNEAVRAHMAEVLRTKAPSVSLTGVDISLEGETLLSRERLPLSIKRIARRNIKLAVADTPDETIQVEETQLAFRWLPPK